MKKLFLLSFALILGAMTEGGAQNSAEMLGKLKWRNVGPFRGGRSLAVAGVAEQPLTFYFGATGGGVWKTTNGGEAWRCVSDSTFRSASVGAIAVAASDPNVVYVGMGETDIRGNISFGDGMYKSSDAGKTWQHIGLKNSWAIGEIVIHPNNPNIVWVAALGNPFGRGENAKKWDDRGIFMTTDGGKTWSRTLAPLNNMSGAIDVCIDPTNPSILYASMWECYRNGYSMSSGGEGSQLYKSMDGGLTWRNISKNVGLPVGILGKCKFAVSYFDGSRVWAMVENKNGGLFRSDDGGETWQRVNNDKNIWQRPWYYMEIAADPAIHDGIYILNVNAFRSADGGKSLIPIRVHHGDNHDIWINPKNPDICIIGDDGGAEVSYDRAKTFSELDIPTAQFYHITLDNDFPYHLYGAQQDNSSIRIRSRNTEGGALDRTDWEVVNPGESGYVVSDPNNSDIVYGGNYMGQMERWNLRTKQRKEVSVNPVQYLGEGADAMKYRFQWTYPILFSPHNTKVLYATSQYVHRSTNGGDSWEIISPDLTRADTNTIKSSGGPITKDNTGAETYATIFAFAESPVKAGVFWAGSDDGFLHVSQDGGKNWTKCTINGLGDWALMSIVEASPFDAGTAYVAANRYKNGDNQPYLFKTTDFGKTWKRITSGIPDGAYCRVIREDPNKKGLLYAGTEIGIYVSFNGGDSWQSLQANLPLAPIHDLQVQKRDRDLCVAVHGRAFWILDNLNPLYELADANINKNAHLFRPEDAWRVNGGAFSSPDAQVGENAPNAVFVNYYLKEKAQKELTLHFLNENGDSIIVYSSVKDKKGKPLEINKDFYQKEKITRAGVASADAGFNTFMWDMRFPDAVDTEGGSALIWSGSVVGPKVAPGKYFVELRLGDEIISKQLFEIIRDPRSESTDADIAESVAFQLKVRDKLSQTHTAVNELRAVRKQINAYMETVTDTEFKKELEKISKPMLDDLQKVEDELIQHKAKAFQDLLALPIRLNDKIAGLASVAASADSKPNAQVQEAFKEIVPSIDKQIGILQKVVEQDIPKFNKLADTKKASAITVKPKS